MLNLYTSRLDSLYNTASKRRRAQSLAIALLILALSTLAYVPVAIGLFAVNPAATATGIIGLVAAVGLVSGSGVLLFQGNLQWASRLQAFGFWLVALLAVLLPAGVASTISAVAVLLLLGMAALHVSRLDLMVLTGLYALAVIGVSLLQLNALPPAPAAGVRAVTIQGLVLAIGVLISGGLRAANLEDSEQADRAPRMDDVLDIAAVATATLHLNDLLARVASLLRATLDLQQVEIFLVDMDQGVADLAAAAGEGEQQVAAVSLPLDANATLARVAKTSAPQRVDDAELALPLLTGGDLSGVLLAHANSPVFDEATVTALKGLARVIGIAMGNAATFSSEVALLTRSNPVLEAARALAKAQTLDDVADLLRETVIADADRIAIIRASETPEGRTHLVAAGAWNAGDATIGSACPPELAETAGSNPLVITDAADFTRLPTALRQYFGEHLQVSSVAVFPLPGPDRLAGYLLVGHQHPRNYTSEELETLGLLTSQIAALLDSLGVMEQMRHSLDEASLLYNVSLALTGAQTLDEVLAIALDEVARISGADRLTIYQAGPDPRQQIDHVERSAVWQAGEVQASDVPERTPLGSTPVLSQFPQSRANLLFADVENDTQLDEKTRQAFLERGTRSVLVVPVTTGPTWLGAIFAEANRPNAFTGDQVRLSRSIADLTALSVDLQTLLAHTRQAAARERELRSLADALRTASTEPEVHQLAEEGLVQMLNRPLAEIRGARRGERGTLTAEEWRIVQNVEEQAQLSIASINLLERTQHAIMQEQTVSEITAQIQRSAGVDDVMEMTVQALQSMLPEYDVRLRLSPAAELPDGLDDDQPPADA